MSDALTTRYAEAFAAPDGAQGVPSWFTEQRKAAGAEFDAIGFPTTHDENWHYTSVARIAERTFRLVRAGDGTPARALQRTVGDPSWPRAVFVNGQFDAQLSSLKSLGDGPRVGTIREMLRSSPALLEKHLGKLAEWNEHAFTAFNTAFAQDGFVVYVPRNVKVTLPLHIIHTADEKAAGCMIHPRLLVILESHAEFNMIETFVSAASVEYFTNAVAEVNIGEGARFQHYKVQLESREAFHVGTLQATQARNSLFHSFSYASGGALTRTNVYTRLAGEGSEVRLNGLYLADGAQHADHQTFVEHIAPNCASRELYKGILDGDSHGVFNGKIYVDPEAQKTDGKQTNNALLLSPTAQVDTKPQLEIFADDVKCTHGATVGRLDDTALFYLKSRGMGAEHARAVLTYAFAAEVLETVELDALREGLEKIAFERFTRIAHP